MDTCVDNYNRNYHTRQEYNRKVLDIISTVA